jgi:uncharacterized membrane protein YgcG
MESAARVLQGPAFFSRFWPLSILIIQRKARPILTLTIVLAVIGMLSCGGGGSLGTGGGGSGGGGSGGGGVEAAAVPKP